MDVVTLDATAVIEQIMSGKYEALYFSAYMSDTDPASSPDFWLSAGSTHLWNIGQKTPATEWEGRIDELMTAPDAVDRRGGAEAAVRRRPEDLRRPPAGDLLRGPAHVRRRVPRVINVTPAVQRPQLLWSPDTVAVAK